MARVVWGWGQGKGQGLTSVECLCEGGDEGLKAYDGVKGWKEGFETGGGVRHGGSRQGGAGGGWIGLAGALRWWSGLQR